MAKAAAHARVMLHEGGAALGAGQLAVVVGIGLVKQLERGIDKGLAGDGAGMLGIGQLAHFHQHHAFRHQAIGGPSPPRHAGHPWGAMRPHAAVGRRAVGVFAGAPYRAPCRHPFRGLGAGVRGQEFVAADRAVVVGVERVEMGVDAGQMARLAVGLVELAVVVDIQLVEGGFGAGLRLGAGHHHLGAAILHLWAGGALAGLVAAITGPASSMAATERLTAK
jgi:hypothetical protein